ncbi:outer membrane beta-barrel protein [Limibaculum sp. M0105]|uniref:Outer membrane beta-barrel protein n=1 Tax=Thermohalobaculum xanthum TaxID=2753746 RepID=A0A8J7SFJ2_9RHOB|nr:outer membrane beta-barrel protein [Thermohalobaculum xanthum]MBK0398480.1 outer membrane beta-barrel protein [Thermohalobaculum xanthum]
MKGKRGRRIPVGIAAALAGVGAAAMAQDAEDAGASWDIDAGVTVGEMYNDNIFATENDKQGDFITVIQPFVTINGGNETARVRLSASGDIGLHARETGENYEDFLVGGEGRVNLGAETFIFGGADYAWEHEPRTSPDDENGTRPTPYTEGSAFVGVSHDEGRVGIRVGANMRRLDFGNVPSASPPGFIDNNDRDRLMGEFGGRVAYDIGNDRALFVQGLYDMRHYKQAVDDQGYERDSDGIQAAVGVSGDLGPVRGEVLVGVLSQNYEDPAFSATTVPDFGGKVTWRPGPRTTVTGLVDRTIEETTLAGSSGYVSTAAGLDVSHRVAPDLSVVGYAFLTKNDYRESSRTDYVTEIGGGLRYYLTPNVFLGGDYSFAQRSSDVAGQDYDEHTFMLSLGATLDAAYAVNEGFASGTDGGFYGGVQFGHGTLTTALDGQRGGGGTGALAADFAGAGVLGGPFIGYRADVGNILLGVELDGDYGDAEWAHSSNRDFSVRRKDSIGGSAIVGFRTRNDVLLYGRAGAVGTSFETSYGNGLIEVSDTERRLGLRGGIGAEFLIGNGFSGRMEYLLTSYGDYDYGLTATEDNLANMESIARVGLVYSLGEHDAPAPQPADFTGFYVGARVGHGTLLTDTSGERTSGMGVTTLRETTQGSGGVNGGIFAGYGHAFDEFYVGAEIEGELSTSNWNIDRDPNGRLFSAEKKGLVGAMLKGGYIVNDAILVYAKGGVVNSWFDADYSFGGASASRSRSDTGIRVGGGIEFPVTDKLHVNLDYTHTSYDSFTVDYGAGTERFEPSENQFSVGLSYRF